jgi:hypothetical protein
MFRCHPLALLTLAGLLAISGCASLPDGGLGDILNLPLDEATVTAGLKEALAVGTGRTTLSLGAVDGYLGNQLVRIAIPADLRSVTDKLRQLGLDSYVDELEVGMNRAAEAAAGQAGLVFRDAITSMTIADAFGILNGGDNAATDTFRDRTRPTLEARYLPITRAAMQDVGLARRYSELLARYNSIPLVQKPALVELDQYVTARALDGLFAVLATEEAKIRQDPAARTTELLRRVFGR